MDSIYMQWREWMLSAKVTLSSIRALSAIPLRNVFGFGIFTVILIPRGLTRNMIVTLYLMANRVDRMDRTVNVFKTRICFKMHSPTTSVLWIVLEFQEETVTKL